jgi:hypothetical protein
MSINIIVKSSSKTSSDHAPCMLTIAFWTMVEEKDDRKPLFCKGFEGILSKFFLRRTKKLQKMIWRRFNGREQRKSPVTCQKMWYENRWNYWPHFLSILQAKPINFQLLIYNSLINICFPRLLSVSLSKMWFYVKYI